MKIGVLLSTSDPETAWNAFRFANASRKGGHETRVFLMGKGVEAPTLRSPPFDVEKEVARFSRGGGEVLACGTCLDLRKVGAPEACSTSTMGSFVDLVATADRMVSFG